MDKRSRDVKWGIWQFPTQKLNSVSERHRPVIVECVGLPGSGKTTICTCVVTPHLMKGDVPLTAMRPRFGALALRLFALGVSARPFAWTRLLRCLNLVLFARHYIRQDMPMLLDQGFVQKIWSILLGTRSYSRRQLNRAMTAMKPVAPDHVVWIETPLKLAAGRIAQRGHGNSRFDSRPAAMILSELAPAAQLLRELADLYERSTGAKLWQFDGLASARANGRKIDALLSPAAGNEIPETLRVSPTDAHPNAKADAIFVARMTEPLKAAFPELQRDHYPR